MTNANKKLSVHNFYLKNMAFDAPLTLTSFNSDGKRLMEFDVNIKKNLLSAEHNLHEVELHIKVTGSMEGPVEEGGESKVVLEMSFVQGGTFYVVGYEGDELDHILSTTCARMVFPFAIDVMSSTVYKIGLPLMVIPPIDFEVLYQQNRSTHV